MLPQHDFAKKTKKTQEVQYADDDNHPVQKRIFGNGRVVNSGHDGYVLSGSMPHLCSTIIIQ